MIGVVEYNRFKEFRSEILSIPFSSLQRRGREGVKEKERKREEGKIWERRGGRKGRKKGEKEKQTEESERVRK